MASSPQALHPSVHTHREPRISATALAQYLILRPDGQQNILHDSKFSRPPIVTANGDAMRALRAYNQDPKRPKDVLIRVKKALTTRAAALDIKPKTRDEALRCVEIIEMFERAENALGMRPMALSEAPAFAPVTIEGVSVSIRPDFLVSGPSGRVGAAMLRVAKAPDPAACKTEEARDRRGNTRRELARYMVAEMQLLLEAQGETYGIPDRDLCFVADVRLSERIGPAPDHSVRLRDIRAACAQIAKLWPSIEPKPSLFKKK
jgi:hypothetical protein